MPTPSTPGGGRAGAGVPTPSGAAVAPGGELVTITTDLYTAEVDTAGGVITLVSLAKHQRRRRPHQPYKALQRNTERTFVAQAGLIGDGLPNHRTLWTAEPGARDLAAGSDRVELRLTATTPTGDKVMQILTFHRGSYVIDVAFDITNTGSAPHVAVRLLPADARQQAGGGAELHGAGVLRRRRSSTTPTITSRRWTSARSTRMRPIPAASRRTPRTTTTAGSG